MLYFDELNDDCDDVMLMEGIFLIDFFSLILLQAIKMLVDKFLEIASSQAQIVSLGAGFDTLFWRLQDENRPLKAFVEVDFPLVTMRKVHYIRLRKALLEKIATNEG